MRLIGCLPDILVATSLSINLGRLSHIDQWQSYSLPVLVHPFSWPIKSKGLAGDTILLMCTRELMFALQKACMESSCIESSYQAIHCGSGINSIIKIYQNPKCWVFYPLLWAQCMSHSLKRGGKPATNQIWCTIWGLWPVDRTLHLLVWCRAAPWHN